MGRLFRPAPWRPPRRPPWVATLPAPGGAVAGTADTATDASATLAVTRRLTGTANTATDASGSLVPPVSTGQVAFRVRDDSAALNTDAGWLAAENTNPTIPAEQVFRIRFQIQGALNVAFELQYNRNGAGWVTAPIEANPIAQGIQPQAAVSTLSAQFADGDATTQLLTTASGSFVAGAGDEASNAIPAINLSASEFTEIEFALLIHKFYDTGSDMEENPDGTTFEFRVVQSGGTPLPGYGNTPNLTVESPYLLGGCHAETATDILVADNDNGDLYYWVESHENLTRKKVFMLRSTNGGVTWTIVDKAGSPNTGTDADNDTEALGMEIDPNTAGVVHIAHSDGNDAWYHRFRTSSHATNPNTWDITNKLIEQSRPKPDMDGVDIAVRSDGDLIAFYTKGPTTADSVHYKISTDNGATWGTEQDLDGTAGEVHRSPWIVMGANDLLHIFYVGDTGGSNTASIYHKTLDSSDVLTTDANRDTIEAGPLFNGSLNRNPIFGAIYYDDGGVEVVAVAYLRKLASAGGDRFAWARYLRDGTLQAARQISDGTRDMLFGTGGSSSATGHMTNDADTVHALYREEIIAQTGAGIWYDTETDEGGWGTDTLEEPDPGIDSGWIKSIVFTHAPANGGAKVLGFVHDKGTASVGGGQGPIYYSEVVLVAGVTNLVGAANVAVAGTAGLDRRRLLAGDADVATAGVAPLPILRTIAGTSNVATESAASLTRRRLLAATSNVASDASGLLAATRRLTASADVASAGSGLLAARSGLIGTADVATAGSAILAVTRSLAATANVATAGSATLAASRSLAGTADVAARGAAALDRRRLLIATADVASDASADFLRILRNLTGTADVAIETSGLLAARSGLTGTADVATRGSATLAVTRSLIAVADTASDATGTLPARRLLIASADVATESVGALSVTRTVTGTADIAARGIATLALTKPLTGTADVVTDASADFLRALRALTATSNVAADSSAIVATTRGLTATADVATRAVGDLTVVGQVGLAGTADIATRGVATLAATRNLAGTADIATASTATLAATRNLTGTADVATAATAELDRRRLLTAAASTVTDADADFLRALRNLTGTADVASDASGDVFLRKGLTSTADVATTATTDFLRVLRNVTGTADVATDAAGALGVTGLASLTGTADVAIDATGTLAATRNLAGTSDVATRAVANLGALRSLTGTSDVATDATGTIGATRPLTGAGNVAADAAGALDRRRRVTGAGNVATAGTATLTTGQIAALAGTSDTATEAAAGLAATRVLAATSNVAAVATGQLVRFRSLPGTADVATRGSGTLIGGAPLDPTATVLLAAASLVDVNLGTSSDPIVLLNTLAP